MQVVDNDFFKDPARPLARSWVVMENMDVTQGTQMLIGRDHELVQVTWPEILEVRKIII